MPGGTLPTSGGWNRFAIEVSDIESIVKTLRQSRVHLRNDIITGVGGKQCLFDDPSGNPIELFQPIVPEAHLNKGS